MTRGGRDAESVIVLSRADYEQLLAPNNMVHFFATSPLRYLLDTNVLAELVKPTPSASIIHSTLTHRLPLRGPRKEMVTLSSTEGARVH